MTLFSIITLISTSVFIVLKIIQESYNSAWKKANASMIIDYKQVFGSNSELNYRGYAMHHNIIIILLWLSVLLSIISFVV